MQTWWSRPTVPQLDISLVIPTHNRAGALDLTLRKLARQSCQRTWDVLVVDNRSSDHTDAVIRHHKASLPLRGLYEGRPGAAAARNAGAHAASGKRLVFLDDDIVRHHADYLRRRHRVFAITDPESRELTLLVCRADPDERHAVLAGGHPFFPPQSGADSLGIVLEAATDWSEVAELVTEGAEQHIDLLAISFREENLASDLNGALTVRYRIPTQWTIAANFGAGFVDIKQFTVETNVVGDNATRYYLDLPSLFNVQAIRLKVNESDLTDSGTGLGVSLMEAFDVPEPAGVVTVAVQNIPGVTTGVTLTPYSTDTAVMAGDADAGKAVFKWICAPTVAAEAKFLPGSCRG